MIMEEPLDSEASDSDETSSSLCETWIQWFCSMPGNELFCQVDRAFITDNFNLYGIRNHIPPEQYTLAMSIILDKGEQTAGLERAAKILYGLIHARYILTTAGLEAMREKFCEAAFGVCPRELCRAHPVLPVGMVDDPFQGPVKLYCHRCQEVYASHKNSHYDIDGSFFTTTFPHLFFLTYNNLVPEKSETLFVPRVFGFKIHPSSRSNPQPATASGIITTNHSRDAADSWDEADKDSSSNIPAREAEVRKAFLKKPSSETANVTGEKRKLDDDSSHHPGSKRCIIDLVN